MRKLGLLLVFVLGLATAAILITVQTVAPSGWSLGFNRQSGTELILHVQPTEANPTITDQDMEAVQQVIKNRLRALGSSRESSVQLLEPHQLLVWLSEKLEPEQAARILGETAQLEFRAQEPDTDQQLQVETGRLQQYQLELDALQQPDEGTQAGNSPVSENAENSSGNELPDATAAAAEELQQKMLERNAAIAELFAPASITGAQLTDAFVQPMADGNRWEIVIEFDAEGADNFAELSRNIAGTGRSIGIFLDGRLLSAPIVDVQYAETGITGGSASISGQFTAESADELAIQLRSGALPLPVEVIEFRTVGSDSSQSNAERGLHAERVSSIAVLTSTTDTIVRA